MPADPRPTAAKAPRERAVPARGYSATKDELGRWLTRIEGQVLMAAVGRLMRRG